MAASRSDRSDRLARRLLHEEGDQIDHSGLDDVSPVRGCNRFGEGSHHLGAGGVAIGVDDPPSSVPTFLAKGEQPIGVTIELCAECDEMVDSGRPAPGEDSDCMLHGEPSGDVQRVGSV